MSKHTPRPWTDENCVIYAARTNEQKPVAHVEAAFHNGDGEPEANARLIAAAPCLLEALKWALPRVDCSNLNAAARAEYLKAESAISKATGASHE